MKQCTKCEKLLPFTDFHKFKHSKDGYKSQCKECLKESNKIYREKNKDKISNRQKKYREENGEVVLERKRKYYYDNREEISEKNKLYREQNKEKISKRRKKYREENKEIIRERKRKYYYENREKILEKKRKWREENPNYMKEYMKEYIKDNEEFHIKRTEYRKSRSGMDNKNKWMKLDKEKNPHRYAWRTLLNNTIKRMNTKKTESTIDMLGYSSDELKKHLESLFEDGMSWDNYGEWHIDHIIPVAYFDPDTEVSIVNSLDNLQPLWAEENLSKGKKYKDCKKNK